MVTLDQKGYNSTTAHSNHMIKTPFESQDYVLYFTQPTLSAIPTLLSAILSPVENGQTLQQFWSPLYT